MNKCHKNINHDREVELKIRSGKVLKRFMIIFLRKPGDRGTVLKKELVKTKGNDQLTVWSE